MFGFFDPDTLQVQDKVAEIDFISSDNAKNVTRVMITDRDECDQVIRALQMQSACQITTIDGELIEFRGTIAFLPDFPDEAILRSSENSDQETPVKLAFELEEPIVGDHFVIGHGRFYDGALIVNKIGLMPVSREHDLINEPR